MARLIGVAFGALAFLAAVAVPAAAAAPAPSVVAGSTGSRPVVYEVPITGVVDPLVARMVQRGINQARDARAAAVVVRLDTPGGLDTSMRSIIKAIQGSRVPVICWVGPPGSRAASAGTFIMIGCPVAAMAPGTNVGAAHPVGITGAVMSTKVTNDAAAYIRSLAERFGRNADWAERAVRNSVSTSASEAVQIHVADLLAPDRTTLLRAVDGRTVETAAGPVDLAVAGASVHVVHLTLGESLLHVIDDPNIAFILFVAGVAMLVLAAIHHGIHVYGVVGLVLVLSSLVVFSLLPVTVAGLLLLVAAFVLFVIDLKLHLHGAPVVAGIVAFVFGGLYLYNGSVPNARVSRPLIFSLAFVFAFLFLLAVRAVMTSHHAPMRSAPVIGAHGVVVRDLHPDGVVRVNSEEWSARVRSDAPEPVAAGSTVRVVGRSGLTLEVVPDAAQGEVRRAEPGAEVNR
ncbi:MAG: nodulation protein NfeD [Actinobacteria bacterium]|nr:nodulation protein NfeD [Actinomycetota bacterium]